MQRMLQMLLAQVHVYTRGAGWSGPGDATDAEAQHPAVARDTGLASSGDQNISSSDDDEDSDLDALDKDKHEDFGLHPRKKIRVARVDPKDAAVRRQEVSSRVKTEILSHYVHEEVIKGGQQLNKLRTKWEPESKARTLKCLNTTVLGNYLLACDSTPQAVKDAVAGLMTSKKAQEWRERGQMRDVCQPTASVSTSISAAAPSTKTTLDDTPFQPPGGHMNQEGLSALSDTTFSLLDCLGPLPPNDTTAPTVADAESNAAAVTSRSSYGNGAGSAQQPATASPAMLARQQALARQYQARLMHEQQRLQQAHLRAQELLHIQFQELGGGRMDDLTLHRRTAEAHQAWYKLMQDQAMEAHMLVGSFHHQFMREMEEKEAMKRKTEHSACVRNAQNTANGTREKEANNERTEAEAATGQGTKHGAELGVRAEITAEDAAAAVVAKGAGSAEGTMLASEAKGLEDAQVLAFEDADADAVGEGSTVEEAFKRKREYSERVSNAQSKGTREQAQEKIQALMRQHFWRGGGVEEEAEDEEEADVLEEEAYEDGEGGMAAPQLPMRSVESDVQPVCSRLNADDVPFGCREDIDGDWYIVAGENETPISITWRVSALLRDMCIKAGIDPAAVNALPSQQLVDLNLSWYPGLSKATALPKRTRIFLGAGFGDSFLALSLEAKKRGEQMQTGIIKTAAPAIDSANASSSATPAAARALGDKPSDLKLESPASGSSATTSTVASTPATPAFPAATTSSATAAWTRNVDDPESMTSAGAPQGVVCMWRDQEAVAFVRWGVRTSFIHVCVCVCARALVRAKCMWQCLI